MATAVGRQGNGELEPGRNSASCVINHLRIAEILCVIAGATPVARMPPASRCGPEARAVELEKELQAQLELPRRISIINLTIPEVVRNTTARSSGWGVASARGINGIPLRMVEGIVRFESELKRGVFALLAISGSQ